MSQSLERGLKSLILLSCQRSMGVTELAQKLDVNKSTAFRIFETLKKHNMVEQCPESSKYKLGPAVLKMSEQLYKNLNIISIAKPIMQTLSEQVGESSHLCILSNDNAVVIEQIMTSTRLAVNAKIGNSEPLHASSVGKCLLAYTDKNAQHRILERMQFKKYTEKTITDKNALIKELEAVKKAGVAIDDGELGLDIRCIAVPVFNHQGKITYSLGISGPGTRLDNQKLKYISKKLILAGKEISKQLGY